MIIIALSLCIIFLVTKIRKQKGTIFSYKNYFSKIDKLEGENKNVEKN